MQTFFVDFFACSRAAARMELRCLNRKDLIEALAKDIPAGAIRFGCRVAAVAADPGGGNGAVLTMADGTAMKAKVKLACSRWSYIQYHIYILCLKLIELFQVLIGCEGTYSAVARYLGLSPVRTIPRPVLRGFTWYPHGHSFDTEFLRLRVGGFFIGRLTITDNLVHFFVTMPKQPTGTYARDLFI
jgi:2-polyprenyl-6-methoxyphenol hydroxylase-like FAD-dependent oxidoreductase